MLRCLAGILSGSHLSRIDRRIKEAGMNIKHLRAYLMACSWALLLVPLRGLTQQNSDASNTAAQQVPPQRDGQHDFDFELGTWKIHLKKLVHPLTGSTTWVEFDGSSVTRKVWDGRSQLEEFETDSPGGGHIEGMTVRLYDTDSPHFEQSFSDDGGKTWEVNWITDQVRVSDESGKSH
jgi:hypothetical protein